MPLLLPLLLAAGGAFASDPAPPPHCYTTPYMGLFAQEAGHSLAPGVRQHPAFGALVPWPAVHARLAECGQACRLLLLIRHGEATSNVVQARVGPAKWVASVGRKCTYRDVALWDAPLTPAGARQAGALAEALAEGPVRTADLLGESSATPRAVSSPLRRCLNTTVLALGGGAVPPAAFAVSELARERWGINTCDGRHPVDRAGASGGDGEFAPADREADSDGDEALSTHPNRPPCTVDTGLRDLFGPDAFGGWPVVGDLVPPLPDEEADGDAAPAASTCRPPPAFGLVSERDTLWTVRSRETPAHVRARAKTFLDAVWAETADAGRAGRALFAVSHSGFIQYLLEAVGRELYRAANAEVVPVLVRRGVGRECEEEEGEWVREE